MRKILTFAAAALLCAPAAADIYVPNPSEDQVRVAVDQFFEALASEDKTALAEVMIPEGMIFVHNRMDHTNTRIDVVPVSEHLARWAQGTRNVSETMRIYELLVIDDMAQVWGPYSFEVEGEVTHCGVNSLSLARQEDGNWKVGNTSFTMVPPEQCKAVGALWVESE